MSDPRWLRWTLFVALLVLGAFYVLAYAFFVEQSHDFAAELYNSRAREYAEGHPVDLPARFIFLSESADVSRLGSGWHAPAPAGTWSSLNDSWIAIALRHPRKAVAVKLYATAFVSRYHKRIDVSAEINGQTIGKWRRMRGNASEPVEFCISNTAEQSPLMLHLHVKSVASPLQVGGGPDGRQLGLLLTSIELSGDCGPPDLR